MDTPTPERPSFGPPAPRRYAPAAPYKPRANANEGLRDAGYICAIAVPFIGLVIGIVVLTRDEIAHGVSIMLLALVAAAVWMGLGI